MKNTAINPTVWQPLNYSNFKKEKSIKSIDANQKKWSLPLMMFLKLKSQK
ncbi:hypothetical protein [Winogradskyella vidalii]|nr:hypothetical protein [Winogradskyella vidalii]